MKSILIPIFYLLGISITFSQSVVVERMTDNYSQSHAFYNLRDSEGQLHDVIVGRYWLNRGQYYVFVFTQEGKALEKLVLNYMGTRKIGGVEHKVYQHIYKAIEIISRNDLKKMAFKGRVNSFSIKYLTSGKSLEFPSVIESN